MSLRENIFKILKTNKKDKKDKKDKKNIQQLNNSLNSNKKDPYSLKVESIDDIDLAEMFENSLTPEIENEMENYDRKGGIYNYPLQTMISVQHTLEIVRAFFESIDQNISTKINAIIDNRVPNIQLVMTPYDGKEDAGVNSPDTNKHQLRVFVPIRDDIRQLYELVHELTHTLDTSNGDTSTRKILGEVAPQCMERMLDTFLLEMSDEEILKYNFDRVVLKKDIKTRQITTFISRFHNVESFNNRCGDRVKDSRYMLAQIYSAHFNKFAQNSKKQKIVEFINCVLSDDFEGANNVFELQIEKNNELKRRFYINDAIDECRSLIIQQIVPYQKHEVRKIENLKVQSQEEDQVSQ